MTGGCGGEVNSFPVVHEPYWRRCAPLALQALSGNINMLFGLERCFDLGARAVCICMRPQPPTVQPEPFDKLRTGYAQRSRRPARPLFDSAAGAATLRASGKAVRDVFE